MGLEDIPEDVKIFLRNTKLKLGRGNSLSVEDREKMAEIIAKYGPDLMGQVTDVNACHREIGDFLTQLQMKYGPGTVLSALTQNFAAGVMDVYGKDAIGAEQAFATIKLMMEQKGISFTYSMALPVTFCNRDD